MIFLDGAMVYPALQPSIPLCCSRFIQEPGEIVFVPARWWHAVLNLEDFRWEMGEVGWKAFYIENINISLTYVCNIGKILGPTSHL